MNVFERYENVLRLLETTWYLPREVVEQGVTVFQQMGTAVHVEIAREFKANEQEPPPYRVPNAAMPSGDTPEDRMMRRMGVNITSGGTAVLPVFGVLGKRMAEFGMSQRGVSSDLLADTFEILADDERARSVVIDMDTPGGNVLGVELAAQALRHLASRKRVVALSNELMASGGYYIGAQANEIRVAPSSMIGSVGVYATRVDRTKWEENMGLSVHIIRAGAHKAEGHPSLPFTEGERKRIQAEVDQYYDMFVSAVERGRGISRDKALSLADGTIAIGEKAIERGFADKVSSLKETVREMDSLSRVHTTGSGGTAMSVKDRIFGRKAEDEAPQDEEAPKGTDAPADEEDEDEEDEAEAEREAALAKREAELAKREAALKAAEEKAVKAAAEAKRAQVRSFAQKLEAEGVLSPSVDHPSATSKIAALIEAVDAADLTVSYEAAVQTDAGEEATVTRKAKASDVLREHLSGLSPFVSYGEVATEDDAPDTYATSDAGAYQKKLSQVMTERGLTAAEAHDWLLANGQPTRNGRS